MSALAMLAIGAWSGPAVSQLADQDGSAVKPVIVGVAPAIVRIYEPGLAVERYGPPAAAWRSQTDRYRSRACANARSPLR